MRDPRRIKRILSLLQNIWEHQPDVRFNQLFTNLQDLYSQQNNNFGRRKVFKQDSFNYIESSYLDLFYLEDAEWGKFLENYWSSIELEIQNRRDKITTGIINDALELFYEASIETARYNGAR